MGGKSSRKRLESHVQRQTSEHSPERIARDAGRPTVTVDRTPVSGTAQRETAKGSGTNTHTIKAGETLWEIAQKHGVTAAILQKHNPGLDPKNLQPGTKVTIPASATTDSSTSKASGSSSRPSTSAEDLKGVPSATAPDLGESVEKEGPRTSGEMSVERMVPSKSKETTT